MHRLQRKTHLNLRRNLKNQMKKNLNERDLKNAQVRPLPPIAPLRPLRERRCFENDGEPDAWLVACVVEEGRLRHHCRFGEAVPNCLNLWNEGIGGQ